VLLETLIKGDTVREALEYVEFDVSALMKKMRTDVEIAVRENRFDFQECGRLLRFYEEGLQGYANLEDPR
jgi:arginine decarboxylase